MASSDPAAVNLHTLAANMIAMQRLLGRRTGDGALVPADPALIKAAIAAGREHMAGVRTMLAEVPHDPMDPYRRPADKMSAAVAELEALLDMLEEMLSHVGG
jgi:hypothetical protein